MKTARWILGILLVVVFLVLNFRVEISPLLRLVNPLILCCFMALWRIGRGPTPADRVVAIDILGILIIGFCGLLAISTKRDFFIDLAIAWALQSFIGTIALAKFLEGRSFDE